MPRLSIIIPWWDENPALEDTLVSVLQHRPVDTEILVVHSRPYADPWQIGSEVRLLYLPGASEIELINHGIAQSSAPWLHVLRCGCEATEGWTAGPLRLLCEKGIGAVAPMMVQKESPDRIAAMGVSLGTTGFRKTHGVGHPAARHAQDSYTGVGPTLNAGFFLRDAVIEAGGFEPALGVPLADIDLVLALHCNGWNSVVDPTSVVVGHVERVEPNGYASAVRQEQLYWRHAYRSGTARLFLHFVGILGRYLTHPFTGNMAGDLAGRITSWLRRKQLAVSRTHIPYGHAGTASRPPLIPLESSHGTPQAKSSQGGAPARRAA